jgi:hypothetical protein
MISQCAQKFDKFFPITFSLTPASRDCENVQFRAKRYQMERKTLLFMFFLRFYGQIVSHLWMRFIKINPEKSLHRHR